MKLFRTVSDAEWDDYQRQNMFRTAKNTLEGKQFFKSEIGVRTYKRKADERSFRPPYHHLIIVDIDEECLSVLGCEEHILDDFEAITIPEEDLPDFQDCIRFVDRYDI